MFLDPVIRDDYSHGDCESRVLAAGDEMLKYRKLDVGSVVPVHKIEQPPVAVLFKTEDGEDVYKRVRMTKACKHCLGPQHTADEPPCPFKEFCRDSVCHAHLPSLPNEGRGHCCAQGIPFDGHDTCICVVVV